MSTAAMLAPSLGLPALIGLIFLSAAIVKRRRQAKVTQDFARRYAASGVSYTSAHSGLGTSDADWTDQVSGIRGGFRFTVHTEIRKAGSTQYSAGGALKDNELACHHSSVFLARHTPELRIWPRTRLEDDQYAALHLDRNAGAVSTGYVDFDDHFLVFCEDLPFVRATMTPELVSWLLAQPMTATYAYGRSLDRGLGRSELIRRGIELRNGELSLEEIGGRLEPDRVFAGVDYLVELLCKLPAELVPEPEHAAAREGEQR